MALLLATSCAGQAPQTPSFRSAPRDTPAGAYLAGRHALNQGLYAEAAETFAQALEADPDNAELRREVFFLDIAGGLYEDALVQAREITAGSTDANEAQLFLALHAITEGEDASAELAAIDQRSLPGLVVPMIRAWLVTQEGANGTDELGLSDDSPLATIAAYQGALMRDVADDPAGGLQLVERWITGDRPEPERVAVGLARIRARAGELDTARTKLEQAYAQNDQSLLIEQALATIEQGQIPDPLVANPTRGIADTLLGIAEILEQQRPGDQPILYTRYALYVDPDYDAAWLGLGDTMARAGSERAAIEAYDNVSEDSPLRWEARIRRAQSLARLERVDDARSALERMIDERPERIDAVIALADLMRREQRFDEAAEGYREAIDRIGPIENRHWRLFYALGISQERTDRWSQAEASLLRALALSPDEPFVLNYLGYSWVDQGTNLERAEQMLIKAVELRPEDGFIVDSLGWAYFRLGRFEQAVEQLERAVELEPGDPVINDHLGDAYWRVGRRREAIYQWRRTLSMDPDEEVEAAVRDKLADGLPAQNDV
ncbi:MAG: tetratricopeptide repeat protein [Geminicoccaceae bacterium]